MVLAIQHATLPRTLHAGQPSPHVDWSGGAVSLLTDTVPWPDYDRKRRAAVSSFGISGTNAHVILEQPPAVPDPPTPNEPADAPTGHPSLPWIVSARTESALRHHAGRLRDGATAHP